MERENLEEWLTYFNERPEEDERIQPQNAQTPKNGSTSVDLASAARAISQLSRALGLHRPSKPQPKKRRSRVWIHFKMDEETGESVCKRCEARYNSSTSTSSLAYHLRHVHNLKRTIAKNSTKIRAIDIEK